MIARSLRLTAVPSALRAACAPSASSSAPAAAGALVAARHKSAEALSYTERQALKGRPISPHVMIYAFPIVAPSSITVRVTGVLLTIGTTGIAGREYRCHGRDRDLRRIRVLPKEDELSESTSDKSLQRIKLMTILFLRLRVEKMLTNPHSRLYMLRCASALPPVYTSVFCLYPAACPALALVHPDVAGLLCSLGNSSAAPVAKFAVAFPLLYHWLGGVRHTMWDKV